MSHSRFSKDQQDEIDMLADHPGTRYGSLGAAGGILGGGIGAGMGALGGIAGAKALGHEGGALAKFIAKRGLKGAGIGGLVGAGLLASYGDYKPSAYREHPDAEDSNFSDEASWSRHKHYRKGGRGE